MLIAFIAILVLYVFEVARITKLTGNLVETIIQLTNGLTIIPMFSVILCMWGYGYSIREDIEYRHINNVATRTNYKYYVFIKSIIHAILCIFTNYLCILVAIFLTLSRYPMTVANYQKYYNVGTYELLSQNEIVGFVLIIVLNNVLLITFFFLLGQSILLCIGNMFYVYTSPLLIFYFVININLLIKIPKFMDPLCIFDMSGSILFESYKVSLLYEFFVCLLMAFLNSWLIFSRNRRKKDEGITLWNL